MKIKSALFTLAAITILSCNQKKNGYEIDCNDQKKQAQNQFNYQNYTWTVFSGQGYDYLGEQEFIQRLNQNQIKTKILHITCIPSPNERYENCGEIEMNRLIEKKFGKNFIDSLRYIAKQDFAKNHPEEIFSYEHCDKVSRYPNSTADHQFEKIETDYFSRYPSPAKYIGKNNDFDSYTSCSFIITKNGGIKDLSVKSHFQNKKNNIFEKQFNKQLKDFVLQTQWISGKINGLNVDSYFNVTIYYD
ncbi:hypothetical protein J2787_003928 [Chryseobacterium rhizosphaerae]|uniref:Uncharacterized protein n=1 Tax=Chryseobacterium rhizosphaerae TaxID=395937 RepID=A0AAE3YEB8_9FLAO|nr:hypothetical protein [Chryseobacterium rhizosphaerae]MDR6528491.1 hypothetical protein [Chryseobacterium rhizosphaerae]